ncbi:hypothetical protein Dsin_002232 [Dipteronia sinensis]|uniref:3-hydroxyisobutyryl-coenzyme A hydrolase n=1 Tax=Dipteronia sinensis TaxID=43782 RepID=A0AAE0B5E0_9ROSI|nr:hypothetical protein Dsin_002232 [Dipteronia sinensis]
MKGSGRAFCAGGDIVAVYNMMNQELFFIGISIPWILEFGQKDTPSIRRSMAQNLFTNGQFCNG